MKTEAIHNMILVMQQNAEDPIVSKILTLSRLQLEDLILKHLTPLTESEKLLPTKRLRTEAYVKRTNNPMHLAHIVVNRAYRDEQTTGPF